MKKIISLLLVLILPIFVLVGCGEVEQSSSLDKFKDRPNKIIVLYQSSGYGMEWLEKIAEEYMTNYNEDTFVEVRKTVLSDEERSKIQSGISPADIFLTEAHMDSISDYLEPLTDVYNANATGENVKVIDKVNSFLYQCYLNKRDKVAYSMPYVNQMGYNFAYNKTVLDNAFGKDNYTIPRTTDEFFAFGDQLKAKDIYTFVSSFSDSSDYLHFSLRAWFAQLLGMENYNNYCEGKYFDGQEYVLNESEPVILDKYETEMKDWYEIVKKLSAADNGYMHKDSNSIDFMKAEAVFAGVGFGKNQRKCAFLFNGIWLENEMSWILAEQASEGDPQVIRMMRTPIASSIIKRTPSITTDEKLREVVDYVDGNGAKPSGVTDEDIEIIREARNIVCSVTSGEMVIPKSSKNKAKAKDFLKFMATDKAQFIAQKTLKGIPLLPYGKVYSDAELGITSSDFIKDVTKIANSSTLISSSGQEYSFSYFTNFGYSYFASSTDIVKTLFSNSTNIKTTETYYNELKQYHGSRWNEYITDYKNGMGLAG